MMPTPLPPSSGEDTDDHSSTPVRVVEGFDGGDQAPTTVHTEAAGGGRVRRARVRRAVGRPRRVVVVDDDTSANIAGVVRGVEETLLKGGLRTVSMEL